MDRFKALGVDRAHLPENLTEYFGLFASERANVIRGVEFIRHSPLIGPSITVQGLLVDVHTGRLEWVVNGYDVLEKAASARPGLELPELGTTAGASSVGAAFEIGNLKFPKAKIGEFTKGAGKTLYRTKTGSARHRPEQPRACPCARRPAGSSTHPAPAQHSYSTTHPPPPELSLTGDEPWPARR